MTMVNNEERYMVGLRCPLSGCNFEQLAPEISERGEGQADPERETMRAHLVAHPANELANVILEPQRIAGSQWRTTYRLVKESPEERRRHG